VASSANASLISCSAIRRATSGSRSRRPSAYQPLSPETAEEKARLLAEHYPSQRHRPWYDREAFLGLARIRGIESNTRYAEAFAVTKLTLDLGE